MARPLRIEYAGAWYHVMNRGSERRDIYHDPQHFQLFLDLLLEVHERYQAETHAYCLMDNHYHLLLRTPLPNLSKIMQRLAGIFTQKINKIDKKDGAIFRGRFKSSVIESDEYLLQVSRYIHLNPVSAGMLEKPEEYHWSSYKYYVGEKNKHKWLFLEETLNRFGNGNNNNQIDMYKRFVSEGIDAKIKRVIEGKRTSSIIGSSAFIQELEQSRKCILSAAKSNITVESIIDYTARYFGVEPLSLQIYNVKCFGNIPRKVAIYLAAKMTRTGHKFLENYFSGITSRSVGEVCRRLEIDLRSNKSLLEDIENIKDALLMLGSDPT